MIAQEWTDLIAQADTDALEAAWNRALEQNVPAAELSDVLDALMAAGKADLAEMLAWSLLNDRSARAERDEALSAAHVAVSTVPASGEVRAEAEKLFRKHYADHPHLDQILRASGLSGEQSARRAFRTLDKCLNLYEGAFLYNRFEEQVLQVRGFDALMGQFELVDSRGRMAMLEPKAIADDYDLVDESDFRVLRHFHPERLGQLLEEDPIGGAHRHLHLLQRADRRRAAQGRTGAQVSGRGEVERLVEPCPHSRQEVSPISIGRARPGGGGVSPPGTEPGRGNGPRRQGRP